MIATARALFTIVVLSAATLPLIPIQMVLNRFDRPLKRTLPRFWHRMAARLIGLKITVIGKIAENRPLLMVANHVSWLDIVALSASAPVSFIAKQEVSAWPAFGTLAKLQRTLFIDREQRNAAGRQTTAIASRLHEGDIMVLFAEGTSSSGVHVLDFKSALLGAAQKAVGVNGAVWVQPVAIAYTRLQGMAAGVAERPFTGFYGDMEMAPHLFAVLKDAAIDVTLIIGKPRKVTPETHRKSLAKQLEANVRAMKTAALRGRVG